MQKTTVDQLVNKAIARLDARQIARDEAKRGPKAIGASAELEASKVHRERPAQQEN